MVDINNIDSIEKLEEISDYINYGIHVTLEKHLGKLDFELEKKYAIERLNHFIQGKDNAFTSSNGIRANIRTINSFYIISLLLKSAIERHAFNIVKLKKEKMTTNEDVVAETITEQIADGHLDDILTWVNSDDRVISMLVENYVNFSYQINDEVKEAYEFLCSKNPITKNAMKQLGLNLGLKNIRSK